MRQNAIREVFDAWQAKPGGLERRLRRFGSLLLRLLIYGFSVVVFASAVLGFTLLVFGVGAFRATAPSLALLAGSLAAGYALALPVWRTLLGEYRFRCFYCEGDTARARRHDLRRQHEYRVAVLYTFECDRCGRSDREL